MILRKPNFCFKYSLNILLNYKTHGTHSTWILCSEWALVHTPYSIYSKPFNNNHNWITFQEMGFASNFQNMKQFRSRFFSHFTFDENAALFRTMPNQILILCSLFSFQKHNLFVSLPFFVYCELCFCFTFHQFLVTCH